MNREMSRGRALQGLSNRPIPVGGLMEADRRTQIGNFGPAKAAHEIEQARVRRRRIIGDEDIRATTLVDQRPDRLHRQRGAVAGRNDHCNPDVGHCGPASTGSGIGKW